MVFVEVVVGWNLYPKVPCTKFCVLYCWCSSGQTSGSKKLVKLWKYWSQEYLLCLQSATRLERHTRSGYSLLCRSAAAASRACRAAWINKDRIQNVTKSWGWIWPTRGHPIRLRFCQLQSALQMPPMRRECKFVLIQYSNSKLISAHPPPLPEIQTKAFIDPEISPPLSAIHTELSSPNL